MKTRNFTTPSRSSNPSRIKKKITIASTALQDIKGNFDACVEDIRDRFQYVELLDDPNEIRVGEDILRYQLVSIESLLDYYVHQIIMYGLKKMFNEEWQRTSAYKKINVPLEKVEYAVQHPELTDWIEEIITEHDSKDCRMSATGLNTGLKLIGVNLKQLVRQIGFNNFNDFESKLQEVYKRRCDIVHHADIDNSTNSKRPIAKDEITECINFIVQLCDEIYATVLSMG